jgi:L-alanine-DL-glutamate epimerase-like enolase superfamily enzyme
MKIAAVECLAADAGWRVHEFLKVTLMDGLIGWSEFSRAFNGPGVPEAIGELAPHLIGHDLRSPSVAHILREGRRQSHIGYQASSAISNALLDAHARALGIPVWQLLGPRLRDEVRVYWAHCGTYRVSHGGLMQRPTVRSPADIVTLGGEVVARGFSALKTNLLVFGNGRGERYAPRRQQGAPQLTATPALLRAMADQLEAFRTGAGADTQVMLDLGSNFRVAGAIAMARHAERFDLAWLELELSNVAALSEVRAHTRVPLAGGERLRVNDYPALLQARAVDIPIVDVLFNSVRESLHVAAASEAFDANVAVHNCYSPLATMMAAAFCAVAPNVQWLELDVDGVPWQDEFVTNPPRVVDGCLKLPDEPGWGTEVNEAAVRAHPLPPHGGARA